MRSKQYHVLTINCGSSSIKFALYQYKDRPLLQLKGKLTGIGTGNASITFNKKNASVVKKKIAAPDISAATNILLSWLQKELLVKNISCIGHRIVHGMLHTEPLFINQEILDEFKQIIFLDPEHMPGAVHIIEQVAEKYMDIKQVACFDTAFHTSLSKPASMFALPRRFYIDGVRRYGFHGLSYQYLMEKLNEENKRISQGRIILAHLGSGSSMASVIKGKCVDTTMGFTPAGGLMMGTRLGDIDPGVITFLLRKYKFSIDELDKLVNHQSGLLGVSSYSSDIQDLLKITSTDNSAAEAVALFCYQAKKHLCALTASLGGIDTLVFTGGIGENAPVIRARICDGLKYLGIQLNENRNKKNAHLISEIHSAVQVYVIPADEEYMIAKQCFGLLNKQRDKS